MTKADAFIQDTFDENEIDVNQLNVNGRMERVPETRRFMLVFPLNRSLRISNNE